MPLLSATHNNPDPIPFYIKIEAVSDDEEIVKKRNHIASQQSQSDNLRLPLISDKCCEHEKKLEEYKIESGRTLQLALKTKTEEIRVLHSENKRLLDIERKLSEEINTLKKQLQMQTQSQFREEQSSDSETQDDYIYYKPFKRPLPEPQFRRNKKVKSLLFTFFVIKLC